MKKPLKYKASLLITPFVALLASCDSGSNNATTNTITTTEITTTASDNTSSNAFPAGLMVASPTDTSSDPSASLRSRSIAKATTTNGTAYADASDNINEILSGTTTASATTFEPELFFSKDQDATCYGPKLYYQNHPNGTDATAMGMDTYPSLPTGDLGMWTEKEGSTTEACASAELNARLGGVKDRTYISLMTIATMIRAYESTGKNWPADIVAGSTVTLTSQFTALAITNTTFTTATMSLGVDGKSWTYAIDFSYTKSGTPYDVAVDLVHQTGTSSSTYEGLLTYSVEDSFYGGNCGSMGSMGANDVTYYGSLHYNKHSNTDLRFQSRGVQTCGHNTINALSEAVNSSAISGSFVNPDVTWSDNFYIFTASFDPTTIEGDYTYAWQAGSNDSHTRVFNLSMDTQVSGEAYFGFGDAIQTSQTGEIKGMICNWAGPGNSHTLSNYAQRQHITYSATSEYFEPTNSAASNITYAPTTSCAYDGLGTFGYSTASTPPITAHAAVVVDLLTKGSSDAAITNTIDGRGFDLPNYP